jgi:hypothetical protein
MDRIIKFRAYNKIIKRMGSAMPLDVIILDATERPEYVRNSLKEIEIMQFTGLFDKNGKEIYEGDILRYVGKSNNSKIYNPLPPVKFKNGRFMVKVQNGNNYLGTPSFSKVHEIIGNIYENPDL